MPSQDPSPKQRSEDAIVQLLQQRECTRLQDTEVPSSGAEGFKLMMNLKKASMQPKIIHRPLYRHSIVYYIMWDLARTSKDQFA